MKQRLGFTLIELLVVIAIIAIAAASSIGRLEKTEGGVGRCLEDQKCQSEPLSFGEVSP